MSFLEPNLFIPRKENIAHSTHEMDRALRTNWLAIERWANQGLWSAAMAQSTNQSVGAANNGVPELLTHYSSLWTAKTSAVDTTNSRFVVPSSGIYQALLEVDLFWNSTTTTGSADITLAEITASSSAAQPASAQNWQPSPFPQNGIAHYQVIMTFKVTTTPCYVRSAATIATPSTTPPAGGTCFADVFSLVRIGSIPSAVQ